LGGIPFVPAGFTPPEGLRTALFEFEPLDERHNEADHAAWTSSLEHIRATPGFAGQGWPRPLTLDENRRDLARHARDFAARAGFTYTVLEPARREVIGCVYIYPDRTRDADASVRSWVRASRAELDRPLWEAVSTWLAEAWPFEHVDYAAR
jgi:hypothetical protein